VAPMVPPGEYTVVLKANGKDYRQPVQLLKDPNTKSTEADIQKQFEQGVRLFTSVNTTFKLIDEMEQTRSKLLKMTTDKKNGKAAAALEDKIYQLEGKLFDIHLTGARMDIFRNPPQVLERFLAMSKEGIVSSADSPPTDQQQSVYGITQQQLQEVEKAYNLLKQNQDWKNMKMI